MHTARFLVFISRSLLVALFCITLAAPLLADSRLEHLSSPLSVAHVGQLRDGGTLIVGLVDPHGQADGVLFNYKRASRTRGRLYADGQLVPLGSTQQKKVQEAIQSYLNQQFTPAQLTVLAQGTMRAAAQAYGERGFYAYRLLHAVTVLNSLSKEVSPNGNPKRRGLKASGNGFA